MTIRLQAPLFEMTATITRDLEFVRESDALEDKTDGARGHLEALATAHDLARAAAPVTVADLRGWQARLVGADPLRAEAEPALAELLAHIGRRCADLSYPSDVEAAELIGDSLHQYETIRAFEDGRVGRLLANYLAMRCACPIFVFRASERAALVAARHSALAMRAFIADKLREAVFTLDGRVLERKSKGDFSDIYDGRIVERHELLRAQARWLAAINAS